MTNANIENETSGLETKPSTGLPLIPVMLTVLGIAILGTVGSVLYATLT